MKLDDESGARLRALGERNPHALDDAAVERIATAVRSTGPRVVRRARTMRNALRTVAALSAIGLAWSATRLLPASEPIAKSPKRETNAAPSTPRAIVPQLACEQRALPSFGDATSANEAPPRSAGALPLKDSGAQRMELGALGTLVAQAGTALWLDASDGCRVRVRLLEGKLSMHAADLGGGELRVVTASGEVVVHGTIFSVAYTQAHTQGRLTVDVAEGRVSVEHFGRTLVAALDAGQRAQVAADQARVEPLASAERAQLLARFSAQAAAPDSRPNADSKQPAPPHAVVARRSADELVREADNLWREAKLEAARARYREAGALTGPTAEAAWLALARRELSAGRPAAAEAAIVAYAAHFQHGSLAGEAEGIAFRTALARGDQQAARTHAERLTRKYPNTVQADAAARWLGSQPK